MNLDEKLITGVSSQYYSTPDGLNSAVDRQLRQLRGFYGREQLHLAHAGRHRHLDGGRPVRLEQQGLRLVRRRPEQHRGAAGQHVEPGVSGDQHAERGARSRSEHAPGIPADRQDTLLGEAHFLRALNYFTLVQTFGDVTLSMHENKGVVDDGGARLRRPPCTRRSSPISTPRSRCFR